MNNQKEKKIFDIKNHTGVMQDKYPPGRITAGMIQPPTATVVADLNPRVNTNPHRSQNAPASAANIRPKHHGSETRQTLQIAGRVSPAIKSEVASPTQRLDRVENRCESYRTGFGGQPRRAVWRDAQDNHSRGGYNADETGKEQSRQPRARG